MVVWDTGGAPVLVARQNIAILDNCIEHRGYQISMRRKAESLRELVVKARSGLVHGRRPMAYPPLRAWRMKCIHYPCPIEYAGRMKKIVMLCVPPVSVDVLDR